jgi:LAO/AO transport system kinase
VRNNTEQLHKEIREGNFRALARGITIVENRLEGSQAMLLNAQHSGKARVVGITGPPGAGKSTMVSALLRHWLKEGKRVAVLAVDPSSPFNYGALLGDRIRMSEFYTNPNVYIRSLASRGALGGLNARMIEITDLVKEAPFDYIIVETVGVGQSEVEIAGLADCTIVALVPEAGDEVQTLKAGIMEIADIFVVNKADRDAAEALYRNLRILAHERAGDNAETPVVKTVATEDKGVGELANAIATLLESRNAIAEKRIQLLVEKTRQLIQAERMRDIINSELEQALLAEMKKDDFNLYAFTKRYLTQKAEIKAGDTRL